MLKLHKPIQNFHFKTKKRSNTKPNKWKLNTLQIDKQKWGNQSEKWFKPLLSRIFETRKSNYKKSPHQMLLHHGQGEKYTCVYSCTVPNTLLYTKDQNRKWINVPKEFRTISVCQRKKELHKLFWVQEKTPTKSSENLIFTDFPCSSHKMHISGWSF